MAKILALSLLVLMCSYAQTPLDSIRQSIPKQTLPDALSDEPNPPSYTPPSQTQDSDLDIQLPPSTQTPQEPKQSELESDIEAEHEYPYQDQYPSELTPHQIPQVQEEAAPSPEALIPNKPQSEVAPQQAQDKPSPSMNESPPEQEKVLSPKSDANPINPEFFNYNKNPSREKMQMIGIAELKDKIGQCEEGHDQMVCFEVGMLYYQGRTVYGQKLQNALYFFDRSCDEKRGLGCYEAGIISANAQSYQHAFIFLEKSCQSKDLRGCKNLGILYYNGWGTPRNLYRATELFSFGCKSGDKLACQKLYLSIGNAYQESFNYAGAKKNYQKACELGESQACQNIKTIELLEKQMFYQNRIQKNPMRGSSSQVPTQSQGRYNLP
ncbi:hypothetical protein [Helicobacter pametensis]|uniref:hypothetical protein n=1 Tax=Helicobacter pametensis TaxID=95149 RepID=UPI0004805F4E|nr:hypothetical protein [Helicobacter pametensis]